MKTNNSRQRNPDARWDTYPGINKRRSAYFSALSTSIASLKCKFFLSVLTNLREKGKKSTLFERINFVTSCKPHKRLPVPRIGETRKKGKKEKRKRKKRKIRTRYKCTRKGLAVKPSLRIYISRNIKQQWFLPWPTPRVHAVMRSVSAFRPRF